MAHTPGPWHFEKMGSFRFVVGGRSENTADHEPVAVVDSMACDRKGQAYQWCQANAQLIAAAPALLAACKEVLRCSALPEPWAEPIRAAIASAEGTP